MENSTIKELRIQTGMSQSQFAEHFGVSVRSLQGWEAGKKPPQGVVGMMARILELERKNNAGPR